MSYTPLQSYFDKQDSFEIIRDQIGMILVNEVANQQALAAADGVEDLTPWTAKVFLEHANPWEQYLEIDQGLATPQDLAPIINVWYEGAQTDEQRSNIMEQTGMRASYSIDCYAYGRSKNDGAGGHYAGDREAAFALHRTLRLARNILMAAPNTQLQLPPSVVGKRMHRNTEIFQPQSENQQVQKVQAGRLVLEVWLNEYSPQYEGQPLEEVGIEVRRASDDSLLASMEFDYTS